jgi:lipopolysaccharide export system permease protein
MINPFKMLWQRYLYKEALKTLILSLFCFFVLFAVIDYSVHMRNFLRIKQIDPLMIVAYYGLQFIKHLDILLPLSLLVATIKVLRTMSERHELLALQAAGVPAKRIVLPFLSMALAAVCLNFAGAELFLPASTKYTENFQTTYLKRSTFEKDRLRVLELKDGSRLAFQHFDNTTTTFHDLFWIRSVDDIWRIKSLKLDRNNPTAPPLCNYVDHITRGNDGGLHKVDSYEEIRLAPLKAGSYQIKKSQLSFESYSLSKLFKELHKEKNHLGEISSEFFMKCARPFLPLLAILSIVPFCLRYSRLASAMPLYSLGIFGTIAYFVVIQAGGILTQNQIVTPWVSIIAPLIILLSWSTLRFIKL